MIPFKGRLSMKQYMPLKPVKRGIKVCECADSSNGFVCAINVYTGIQRDGNPKQGLWYRVVHNLTRTLVGKTTMFTLFKQNINRTKSRFPDLENFNLANFNLLHFELFFAELSSNGERENEKWKQKREWEMRLLIIVAFWKGFDPFFMFPFLSLVLVTSVLDLNGRFFVSY